MQRYFLQSLHLILFVITLMLHRVYSDSKMQITSSMATLIAVAMRNCSKNS